MPLAGLVMIDCWRLKSPASLEYSKQCPVTLKQGGRQDKSKDGPVMQVGLDYRFPGSRILELGGS